MNPIRHPSIEVSGDTSINIDRAPKSYLKALWLVPTIAAVVTLVFLVIEHVRLSQIGTSLITSFLYALLIGFPATLCLNWIGFHYSKRYPRLIFAIFAAALFIIATCGCLLGALLFQLVGINPPAFFWSEIKYSLPICLVITFIVGLSISSFETVRHRLQDATLELRTKQMEQERANQLMTQARLSSLESRIHPHFLFNTLNSISSLIPTDPKRAEATVGRLASLLRFSISANQSSLVPLAQELKIVRDYLEIEATRFGPRLRYEISVPDSLGAFKVPPLALQTLVENSIKHVVSNRNEPSFIRVEGAMNEQLLELAVIDDGQGFSLSDVASDHGLGNLVGRLELLFGETAQLNVKRGDGQTIVAIKIPPGDLN